MLCKKCGTKASSTDKFCINCGEIIHPNLSNNAQSKNHHDDYHRNLPDIKDSSLKKSKWPLPVSILLSVIILGGFLFAMQVQKQKSIERQQQVKSDEERRVAEVKAEQDKKEFAAKKKNDCLSIYKTESDKWNNVRGWRYQETDDNCFIRYKAPVAESDAQCDIDYPTGGDYGLAFLRQNSLCKDGEFENIF